MVFLYATSGAWGITGGTWIDTLGPCAPGKPCDPGLALVAPLLLGVTAPLGFFLWDNFAGMHKGVPMSIGTGMIIGALEGLGVAGANAAIAGPTTGARWSYDGVMSSVFVGSTLGGIGGWAFGEAVRPDPRKMTFVASGAGWGAGMGMLLGGGAANSDMSSIGQGVLVGNLVGINVGVIGAGVLAAVGYDPSWASLKWMWIGGGVGLLATSPIYLIYVATGAKDGGGNSLANHGMVANSFGILAGVVLAGILTRDLKDTTEPEAAPTPTPNGPPGTNAPGPTARRRSAPSWRPPFTISIAPLPNGASLGVFGEW